MSAARSQQAKTRNLLIELGTEELPPKALKTLAERFAGAIVDWLGDNAYLEAGTPEYKWYATPRRLAVWVKSVRRHQPDQVQERRGPALAAAYDADNKPTRAASGFAGSCGVPVESLERLKTNKGEWLVFRSEIKGKALSSSIEQCVRFSVERLPIPKRMRWGSGNAEFVRPVHWLVILHGSEVLDATILDVCSGQNSRGHRFHAPGWLCISSADRYAEILKDEGSVWADYEERKLEIYLQAEGKARQAGATPVIDENLLEEVTGLVERPEAIAGKFDERFLDVPDEALVSAMRDHQKYFHMVDADGGLLPHFITISNIKSSDPERVRQGNERVLRARLADADFFWQEDKKRSLESRLDDLKGLMFHRKLGSVYDKTRRLMDLARKIAREQGLEVEACMRAAQLCKSDLVTEMVGEFPELQGTMGRYYALHDGETEAVALAIEQHYFPRHAGDAIPSNAVGRVVAIAEKIDILTGIFASGEQPSGDKDPYALRRMALGLIRILIEGDLDLDLAKLVKDSAAFYQSTGIEVSGETCEKVVSFIVDRYPAHYASSGFAADEIAAVTAVRSSRPLDLDKRLRAVAAFRALPAAASLAAANKRISNILKKAENDTGNQMNFDLLREPAENDLASMLVRTSSQVSPLVRRGDYEQALEILSGFRETVDRFFDEVMVMDPDKALRGNRLALLGQLSGLFMGIADVSCLQSREGPK